MAFTNSIWAPDAPSFHLFEEGDGYPYSARELVRFLSAERGWWKSQVFVLAAFAELHVSTGSALEREVMKLRPQLVHPYDRPHLFDHMQHGRPEVDKVLGNVRHHSRRWVELLLRITKEPVKTLSMPVWRLLDPALLTWVEYEQWAWQVMWQVVAVGLPHCSQQFQAAYKELQALRRDNPARYVDEVRRRLPYEWRSPLSFDSSDEEAQGSPELLPRPDAADLRSWSCLLLSLRYWELVGDLDKFYLTLREVILLLGRADAAADLRPFQSQGAQYLRSAFGRVAVGRGLAVSIRDRLERAERAHSVRAEPHVGTVPVRLQLDAVRAFRFVL